MTLIELKHTFNDSWAMHMVNMSRLFEHAHDSVECRADLTGDQPSGAEKMDMIHDTMACRMPLGLNPRGGQEPIKKALSEELKKRSNHAAENH
jgi:hypothetical protein